MRFQIKGANAESGDDVDVMLDAPTRPDVEKIAHDRGILVESIRELEAARAKDTDAIALVDESPAPHTNGNGASHASHAPAAPPAAAPAPLGASHASNGHGEGHSSTHMEYHIMMNQSLYLLETAVNRHLKEGWEPQGGICIGVSNNAMQYFQALIRRPKAAV